MAYTNAWSNIIPAGSAAANTIDDAIRQLRLDIQERMDTILAVGSKWTDDPIGIDLPILGARTGVEIMFSHHLIRTEQDEDDANWFETYFEGDNGPNSRAYMPLRLPVGAIIQGARAVVEKAGGTGGDFHIDLKYRTYGAAGTTNTVASYIETLIGVREVILSSSIGHLVQTDRMYYMMFNNPVLAGRHKVFGVKLIVDLPSLTAYV